MHNNLLSILIPTFNRAQFLDHSLGLHIALFKKHSIQIIVIDNASTDDTIALLKQIEDKRLFIYQTNNNSSLSNSYNTFSKARGKYIYITIDKDFIKASNIDKFLFFLQNNKNLSCGYCEYFFQKLQV